MSFTKRVEDARRASMGEAAYNEFAEERRTLAAKQKRNERIAKAIGVTVAILLGIVIYGVVAWVIQWGWNAVAASVNGPVLSYKGSCGITVLLAILSMFFKRSSSK